MNPYVFYVCQLGNESRYSCNTPDGQIGHSSVKFFYGRYGFGEKIAYPIPSHIKPGVTAQLFPAFSLKLRHETLCIFFAPIEVSLLLSERRRPCDWSFKPVTGISTQLRGLAGCADGKVNAPPRHPVVRQDVAI